MIRKIFIGIVFIAVLSFIAGVKYGYDTKSGMQSLNGMECKQTSVKSRTGILCCDKAGDCNFQYDVKRWEIQSFQYYINISEVQ